eukprot:3137466-Karenia_brevis.AAC.1
MFESQMQAPGTEMDIHQQVQAIEADANRKVANLQQAVAAGDKAIASVLPEPGSSTLNTSDPQANYHM